MRRDGANRRRFLHRTVAVAGATSLAGCLTGGSGSEDDGGSQGDATDGEGGTNPTDEGDSPVGTEASTTSSSETTDSPPTTPRDVSFEAPHGATVEATAYGSGDCGVVLVPQINKDRGSWRSQAEVIAGMGHGVLAIDEDPDDRSASVRGAVRYLRDQTDVSTVVLVGASSGGEAVVVANAETNATVDGTITLSAAGGADRTSDLEGRSLFVVSTGDDDRFVSTARKLHQGAPQPTNLVEYEGSAHGQGILDSEHGDDLLDRIRTFVADVCGT